MHGLEITNGLAELFAFLHVLLGLAQGRLGGAQRAAGDIDTPAIQTGHGDAKALPFFTDQAVARNTCVFQNHCPGGLALPAHLGFVAAIADARGIRRHCKAGNAAGTRPAGTCHQYQHIGITGPGDKRFGTVQHIVIAVFFGGGT